MKIVSLKDYFTLNEQAPSQITNWLENKLRGVRSGNKEHSNGRLLSDEEVEQVINQFKEDEKKVNNRALSQQHAEEILNSYINKANQPTPTEEPPVATPKKTKKKKEVSANTISTRTKDVPKVDVWTDDGTRYDVDGKEFKDLNTYLNGKNIGKKNYDKVAQFVNPADEKTVKKIDKMGQAQYNDSAAFNAEKKEINKVSPTLTNLLQRFVREGDNAPMATNFVDRYLTWEELNKGNNNRFVYLLNNINNIDNMIKNSRDFIDLYNEYCSGESSDFYTGRFAEEPQKVIDEINSGKYNDTLAKTNFTNVFRKAVKHDNNHAGDTITAARQSLEKLDGTHPDIEGAKEILKAIIKQQNS